MLSLPSLGSFPTWGILTALRGRQVDSWSCTWNTGVGCSLLGRLASMQCALSSRFLHIGASCSVSGRVGPRTRSDVRCRTPPPEVASRAPAVREFGGTRRKCPKCRSVRECLVAPPREHKGSVAACCLGFPALRLSGARLRGARRAEVPAHQRLGELLDQSEGIKIRRRKERTARAQGSLGRTDLARNPANPDLAIIGEGKVSRFFRASHRSPPMPLSAVNNKRAGLK